MPPPGGSGWGRPGALQGCPQHLLPLAREGRPWFPSLAWPSAAACRSVGQGCVGREGTSEATPEAVRQAVAGGFCRLQMPLKLVLASGRQWLGVGWAPWRGGRGLQCIPGSRCPHPLDH